MVAEYKSRRNSLCTCFLQMSPSSKPIPCPVHQNGREEVEQFQIKEEIKYYDYLTWRMYHRIQMARAKISRTKKDSTIEVSCKTISKKIPPSRVQHSYEYSCDFCSSSPIRKEKNTPDSVVCDDCIFHLEM
jgi:hypothetical protein